MTLSEFNARVETLGYSARTIGEDGDFETMADAEKWLLACEQEQAEEKEADEAKAAEEAALWELREARVQAHLEACDAIESALRYHHTRNGCGGRPNVYSDSTYYEFRGVTIRVSDHAQKVGGGFRVNSRGEEGRFGEAEVCFFDGKIPSREEIRAIVAEAIYMNR
jgi:hypothetical protein